ncbi:MAG: transcription elongation factor GreA [Clostridiales bacterium]|nr:transcription elongation factor GreA [Clostridiales bacterium]
MSKEIILTEDGYKKLEEELDYLKGEKRQEIAERIKVALGFGDISENSEYDEAKNEQALIEMKIAELENKIRNAKVIDESDISTRTVSVGTKVKLLDIEYDEEIEYSIVGITEVDLENNKISNESPIAAGLIGRKKGETVDIDVPAGKISFKILGISKL